MNFFLLEIKYCYCKIKYYTEGKHFHVYFWKNIYSMFNEDDDADTYIQQLNVTARFPLMS